MVARHRRHFGPAAGIALDGAQTERTVMLFVASAAGAIAGGIGGVLINIAVMVLSPEPRIDHSLTFGVLGSALGAAAFAVTAEWESLTA